ncbi:MULTISPECIES: hypothetical protein [unclassified Caballeronia]|uniref:hypothetical protein n=1 Tax=unclassified Caballeronia TaxID=2646786 RepID=UPI002854CABA|nr:MULTISPECIES: hypothetical protein [unclassified Caballeronia]MDR5738415.1 hypothetical protein [Caballeronia sp. LZ016]MDR5811730.1 hypothetical protein [Caballeronia sp. LZ019]
MLYLPPYFERFGLFATSRHFTEVTRDELADIGRAMAAARAAFLAHSQIVFLSASTSDLRAVLGRIDCCRGLRVELRERGEVIQAVLDAVKQGRLIFVPRQDELRACVETIRQDMRISPAVTAARSLSDGAQALRYGPATSLGDAVKLAARGLSDADEAECDAMYEARMTYCNALSKMYGGDARTYLTCKQRAFEAYQACRGYL